jgi:hypothetical protein|tara:strand:- start:812 stop:1330 length:519 start_codon:yes stop_codon:yes gene_type:complete
MKIKPLRHFRGIGVSQSSLVSLSRKHKDGDDLKKAIVESEKDLKICCSPYDEQGESIYCEEEDIFERKNHDKNFLFKIWEGGVKILEIHYFGKWSEYEFCDAPHAAWAPEVEKVGLTNQEQERAFTLFKQLVADTEEINGFPITDNRHELYFQPEFRGLLIRILNSKIYNEV